MTTEKIYDRCSYLNCYNGKFSTGHKLFRFPAYSDSRHHLWIRYTGNSRLRTWASSSVRRAGLCADHFARESFIDDTLLTLRRHAVPKPYSAREGEAKPSSTLLNQIMSLSRKSTRSQKVVDSENTQGETVVGSSKRSSEVDDPPSTIEKPMPAKEVKVAVKTLRKVKRLKIEEQLLNSDRTVILEKCKKPDTCPASRHASQKNGKPRPHFHKVCINNIGKVTLSTSGIRANPSNARKTNDSNSSLDKSLQDACKDTANAEVEDDEITIVAEKPGYRFEKYHINLPKTVPETEESPTTSRYSGDPEQKSLMSGWQAVQETRAEPALPTVQAVIDDKQPSTTSSDKNDNKIKDEKSFDRCLYINCKKGRFTSGVRLFRFPKVLDPRMEIWIKNSGNPRMMYWSGSTIRRAGICGDHFTKESFFNETCQRLLRTAVPKPFYLEKNIFPDDKRGRKENILKMFDFIEKKREKVTKKLSQPVLIDLPNERSENRENLKINYSFENSETMEIENDAETSKSSSDNTKGGDYEGFASILMEPERIHLPESNEVEEILSATSELICMEDELFEEPDEDPLDTTYISNDNNLKEDFEGDGNITEIIALHQQKAELCKIIKEFSVKLKEAKIHKDKLRSQLLAYKDLKTH